MTDTPPVPDPQSPSVPQSQQPPQAQQPPQPPYVQPQQAPQYQQPYAPTAYATGYAPPTNTLAIIALIGSFLVPIVGIICGHMALAQIKRTGESGRALALAGTIIGYVYTALIVLIIAFSVFVPLFVLGVVGANGGFS